MGATRKEVFEAINTEREFQDTHWQQPGDPNGGPNQLTIGECILLIEEYASKARAEWRGEPKPETRTLEIVRKIAGVAVNCMEQHGAPKRDLNDTPDKY